MGGVAVAVYLNGLDGGFVNDAAYLIGTNRALLESTEWLPWLGRDYYWGSAIQDVRLYRPLTVLSFLAHLRTTGPTPVAFLLGNVLLHAVVSLLVLRVGRRLVGPVAAVIGALLFAAHPLHTEAVAWVMGRADLLAAVFALGACLLGLRSLDPLDPPAAHRAWLAGGAVLAYLAALGSKEHVAPLPLWLGLAWLLGRPRRPARELAGSGLGFGLALASFLVLRGLALTREPEAPLALELFNPAATVPAPIRWLTAVGVVGRYAGLCLWPRRLSVDYSFAQIEASRGLGAAEVGGLLTVLALLGAFALAVRRHPGLALALGLAPVTFVVVSNVPFPIATIMAERLTYLPSAGLCLGAGWVIGRLPLPAVLGRWSGGPVAATAVSPSLPLADRPAGGRRWTVAAGLVAVLLALSARTVVRNRDWRDPVTLAVATAQASPRSASAQAHLAVSEQARGNLARAEELARLSVRIYPGNLRALMVLAEVLAARGEWREASEHYRRAVALVPSQGELRSNLGSVLARLGRLDEAETELREAIRVAPGLLGPRIGLGGLLLEARRPAEALAQFEEAVRIAPGTPLATYGLAEASLALGDREAAARHARAAAAAGMAVPERFWRALGAAPWSRPHRAVRKVAKCSLSRGATSTRRCRSWRRRRPTGSGSPS